MATESVIDDDIDIWALGAVLWRRRNLIVSVAFLACAAAVAYALSATPLYRGEAVIAQVQNQGSEGAAALASQLGGLVNLAGVQLSVGGALGREANAVLRSRRLAEEFVVRNKLGSVLAAKDASSKGLWFAVEKFRNDVLKITEDKRSATLTVSMVWTDGQTAARWANAYVALANETLRSRAIDEAQRNMKYLREQVSQTAVLEMQAVMYRLIESEMKALMLARGRSEYAFTVVDPAVIPEQRFKPRRRLIVVIGLILGLVLGSAVALVRDRFHK